MGRRGGRLGAHRGIRRASCDCIWLTFPFPLPPLSSHPSRIAIFLSQQVQQVRGKRSCSLAGYGEERREEGGRAIIEIRWDRTLSRAKFAKRCWTIYRVTESGWWDVGIRRGGGVCGLGKFGLTGIRGGWECYWIAVGLKVFGEVCRTGFYMKFLTRKIQGSLVWLFDCRLIIWTDNWRILGYEFDPCRMEKIEKNKKFDNSGIIYIYCLKSRIKIWLSLTSVASNYLIIVNSNYSNSFLIGIRDQIFFFPYKFITFFHLWQTIQQFWN